MSAIGLPYRARLQAQLEVAHVKGRTYSHLLGLVLASEFIVGTAAGRVIPYAAIPMFTGWLDLPLRLLALWLILDRNWRVGRLRIGMWDGLLLGFPIIVGISYIFTNSDPSIASDFESYRGFVGDMVRFYTVYLLIREGYNRAGFRGDVVVKYVLAALAASAFVSILQTFNVGPIRELTDTVYGPVSAFMSLNEPYRARGLSSHWNGFACNMVMAIIIVLAPLNWRRLKVYEIGLALLFTIGLLVSTSRGGYATLGMVAFSAGCYYLYTRRRRTGAVILGILFSFVAVFAVLAVALDIPRFRDLFQPPKVQSNDLDSWKYRLEVGERLIDVGLKRPLTGTGPSAFLYDAPNLLYKSESSVEGIRDMTYPLIFAQFGLFGLFFMAGIILFFVRYGKRARAVHPYAAMAFLTGIAFAVQSSVEFVLLSKAMILVCIVAGMVVSKVAANSPELKQRAVGALPIFPRRA